MSTVDGGIGDSGYSLEELSAYHDRGRFPPIAAIDTNAECQAVLASLARFGDLSRELVSSEQEERLDEGWMESLMRDISWELRAGRDIVLSTETETELVITEGAVRELIREAGDVVPGVIIGRSRLTGDTTHEGGRIDVVVSLSVRYGHNIAEAAERIRAAIRVQLERHTLFEVGAIDVTVDNVHTGHDDRTDAGGTR